jgi:hypothetical protein
MGLRSSSKEVRMRNFHLDVERFLCYAEMNPEGSTEICCHDMCGDLEPLLITLEIVNPRYQPFRPGRYSAPPEDCYPDEPEEFEFEVDQEIELSPLEEGIINDMIRNRADEGE